VLHVARRNRSRDWIPRQRTERNRFEGIQL
jgi:hypothetical protein